MFESKGVLPTLIGALTGAAVAAMITGYSNLNLEKRKADHALLLEVVKVREDAQRATFVGWLAAHDVFYDKKLQSRLAADAILQPQTGEPIPSIVPAPPPAGQLTVPSTTPPSTTPLPAAADRQWGVVIGAYDDLPEAQRKLKSVQGLGFTASAIHKRGKYFQIAIPFSSISEAQSGASLLLHKDLSKSPQVIDLRRWCPHPTPKEEYVECASDTK